MQRSNYFYLLIISSLLFFASPYAVAGVNVFDLPVLHPAIPLLDEAGEHVMNSNKPYSSRMSCGNGEGGGCHDIDKISKAYHFEMGRDESDDDYGKKIAEANDSTLFKAPTNHSLVSPGYFGGFNCGYNPGQVNNPQWLAKKRNSSEHEFLDYGAPGLIKNCAQCHNGGGFAEKDRNGLRYDLTPEADIKNYDGDYYDWLKGDGSNASGTVLSKWDWQKSGVIEPDCMICHTDFTKMTKPISAWDTVRTQSFINNGFFRFANSAIFAYLNVAPDSPAGKTLLSIPGDQDSNGLPVLKWDASAFDSNGKIQIPMLRFPGSENCMVCHKTSHDRRGFYGFGPESLTKQDANGVLHEEFANDIHKGKLWPTKGPNSRYIENCNSCHSKQYYKETFRNIDLDADHNFLMGNSEEDVRKDLNYKPSALSCEYCHNGSYENFKGAENPALPSGFNNILDAHRELWIQRGDMKGYPTNSLDRTVKVHLNEISCQTCHIIRLKAAGADLNIRYRNRKAEDNNAKEMPYKPSTRQYWKDKTNNRVVSRKDYLTANKGVEALPQTYSDFIALKTALDNLLKTKGYANANVQLILTESNEYLISHNSRSAIAAMPCDDCHARNDDDKVLAPIKPEGVIGVKNVSVVSQLTDNKAYAKLVKEGVVKLEMPYFELASTGAVVENIDNVLHETTLNQFTSVLMLNNQDIVTGEFREMGKGDALAAINLSTQSDGPGFSAISEKMATKVFVFNSVITGKLTSRLAVMLDDTSNTLVPNYRLEATARDWTKFSLKPPGRNFKKQPLAVAQGRVSSPLFSFNLQDQLRNKTETLVGNKFIVKLPYSGFATKTRRIDLFATRTVNGIQIAPLTSMRANILRVKPGSQGYVLAVLDRLPEKLVVVDLTNPRNQ